MRPTLNITVCIYPGCTNSPRTRGLCHPHYQTMRGYVRAGRVTEQDLEARGMLAPKGTGGAKANGSGLFLDSTATGGLATVKPIAHGGDSIAADPAERIAAAIADGNFAAAEYWHAVARDRARNGGAS